jgi:glycosyltransferase involved in cell wall biosynthesis
VRILIVSNLYPPHYRGGYEVRCAQAAAALRRAGHDVRVVTSRYGRPAADRRARPSPPDVVDGVPVHRWLGDYAFGPEPTRRPWTLHRGLSELADARAFLDLLEAFRPQVVNWWSMYGLAKVLLPIPASRGIPDVYWIEQGWMLDQYGPCGERAAAFWISFWEAAWAPHAGRPILRALARSWERRVRAQGIPTRDFPNRPRHVCFVSEYLRGLHRDAGFEFSSSEVIHGGVPTETFYRVGRTENRPGDPVRILYGGQLSEDRGLHTLVEAMGRLEPALRSRATLTIAGEGPQSFESRVRGMIEAFALADRVRILGKVPHAEMVGLYATSDVLVFPSTRPEGCPLTIVEALLAGCAVLTTGSGGAMEIAAAAGLPVFPKGDSAALGRLLAELLRDRRRITALAARGQAAALQEFGFDRMMVRLSATLDRVGNGRVAPEGPDDRRKAGRPVAHPGAVGGNLA